MFCRRACASKGANLMWVSNAMENQIAVDRANEKNKNYWLGLRSDVKIITTTTTL